LEETKKNLNNCATIKKLTKEEEKKKKKLIIMEIIWNKNKLFLFFYIFIHEKDI